MSDVIKTYGVKIQAMKSNMKHIQNMRKNMDSLYNHQQKRRSRAFIQNKKNIASETKFAEQMRKDEEIAFRKTQKALTKTQQQEAKKREQIELAAAKKKYGEQVARRRQAVGKITERSGQGRGTASRGALADMLRQEVQAEKEAYTIQAKRERLDRQRVASLEKAKKAVERSAFMQKRDADAIERAAQQSIRRAIATSKTADELRDQVAKYKGVMASEKRLTKQKERQLYLQRRITESSKQYLGNYVSAFAAAGAVAGATRTGQNFESVNNTLISVSENSQEAGEKFEFVRDQAYRLGLNLTESARGFAKLSAAQGNMSDKDTRELFLGVSELSTVMGLSAAESSRALTAVQQINGLPWMETSLTKSY